MSSILTIEDGTGVPDANSYASAAQCRAYALLRGAALPIAPGIGTDPVEVSLVLAAQYLDSLAWIGRMATERSAPDAMQGLAWPRVLTRPYLGYPFYPIEEYFYLGNVDPSYYVLPAKVIAAQNQLVIEQLVNSVTLQPTTVGGYASQFVTREKVDSIETSYSEKLGTLTTPTMLIVNSLLQGLVIVGGGNTAIRAVRV